MNYAYIPSHVRLASKPYTFRVFCDFSKKVAAGNQQNAFNFYLDTNQLMASVGEIARVLSCTEDDICVDLCNVPFGYKLILCQHIVKFGYRPDVSFRNSRCIYFIDRMTCKGIIKDAIHHFICADVSRNLQNQQKPASCKDEWLAKKRLIQTMKTMFGRAASTQVTTIVHRNERKRPVRLLLISLIKRPSFPTICFIDPEGTVICGIMTYFIRYGSKMPVNIVAAVPCDDNVGSDEIYSHVEQWTPTAIVDIRHVNECVAEAFTAGACVSSSQSFLLNQIHGLGKNTGELVRSNGSFQYCKLFQGTSVRLDLDEKSNNHGNVMTGNGVTLGIDIVKLLCKKLKQKLE